MSSEVFKDKITGATILVAGTGKECLEVLAGEKPDMCVVDFDLPDTDGVTLIEMMRKVYKGPILLTAYPDPVVTRAVEEDLFVYNDSGAWIPKPVKFDKLAEKIDQFLLDKHRLGKRFDLDESMETMIIGEGAGRGKRAPKVSGQIVNVSLGGVCIEIDEPMKMKKDEEMTVMMALPVSATGVVKKKITARKTPAKSGRKSRKAAETKIKCKVCWIDRKSQKVGFAFHKLTDIQRKGVEALLRDSLIV